LVVVFALGYEVRRQLEAGTVVGPQYAVFGLGADVEREHRARPSPIVVRVAAVVAAARAGNERAAAAAGVAKILIVTNPTADLDAAIGARNVEEPFAVKAADLHIFDRPGLDGKIGRLGCSHRGETRRAAEQQAFDALHRGLQGSSYGGFRPRSTPRTLTLRRILRAASRAPTANAATGRPLRRDSDSRPSVPTRN